MKMHRHREQVDSQMEILPQFDTCLALALLLVQMGIERMP